MSSLLTAAEEEAISMAGRLYTHIVENVIGRGLTCADDTAELRSAVHTIQHMVMAQAAARDNPQKYRLLGEVISEG